MKRALLLPAAMTAFALSAAPAAASAPYVPGEVIVRYEDGTSSALEKDVQAASGTESGGAVPGGSQTLRIEDGDSVGETVSQLRADPTVAYAVPNYVARASGYFPNDPGFRMQWNLSGLTGVNMPDAWELASARGAPGGAGAIVAVLDTGVAYQRFGRFRRAPDLNRFVRGYDFVGEDRHPNDHNGHGTHVAGTIAQSTGNRRGTAGIAYRARIMPVRVLDAEGTGDTISISRGIRFAARQGADVINLSLEFDARVRASQIPDIVSAVRYARRKGTLVVAAAGNQGDSVVAYPARARNVLGVAASTIRGCQADYSNSGRDVDLVAPGGGADAANADNPYDLQFCRPDARARYIFQETFVRSVRDFGLPGGYEGTSMAAPHVAGAAALLMATGRLGSRHPAPADVERHLEATARDVGSPGFDDRYGHGLLDVAAALR